MSTLVRGAALVIVWSSGFIGAELGARYAPPETVLAWRCLITALVLLPWSLPALGRLGRRGWVRQGVLALLCQCLYLAGVFAAAATEVPAGTSALIASLQPALVLAVAVARGSERLRAGVVLGLALGTAGVALTASADLRAGVSLVALALPLSAMISLTAGTLLQQRWPSPPLMSALAIQAVFSAAFFTVYAAVVGRLVPPSSTGFRTAVAWAVVAGIGSYGLYYLVTSRDGAARASTLLYLTPAATAVWAALMFGSPVQATAVAGLLVSAVAVVVLNPAAGAAVPGQGPDRPVVGFGPSNPPRTRSSVREVTSRRGPGNRRSGVGRSRRRRAWPPVHLGC